MATPRRRGKLGDRRRFLGAVGTTELAIPGLEIEIEAIAIL